MNKELHLVKESKDLLLFKCQKNGKAPAISTGYKGATKNFDIKGTLIDGYNIGLPMEPNGLIGIDMDVDISKGYNGIETIKELERELGELPSTYTQQTPRGGVHKVYFAPNITNPIGKIGKDTDVKFLGYLLFKGSSVNSKYYKAIDGVSEEGKLIFSELPQRWTHYIQKGKPAYANTTTNNNSNKKTYTDVDIDKILNNCRYLAYCADEENSSCLPEPLWHTMVTVLSQIDGAEELIHKLSEPHKNYSFQETQKKIEYSKRFGHSQTCAYISASYPEICKNCLSAASERLV